MNNSLLSHPHLSSQQKQGVTHIKIENALASCELSLYGAHILSFKPKHDNRERIYMSPAAIMDGTIAIRGGIPICWPWFGPHQAQNAAYPQHGYVRTQTWHVVAVSDDKKGTQISLQPASAQGEGFEGQAELTLQITVGNTLTIKLITENKGETAFNYNAALHSYFSVSHIDNVQLAGLQGDYLDKVDNGIQKTTPVPYRFTQEVDRIQLSPSPEVVINDSQLDNSQQTQVLSEGHDSLVIWNPWAEKSAALADMPDDGYLSFCCVETAVTKGQVIEAGNQHVLQQIIC